MVSARHLAEKVYARSLRRRMMVEIGVGLLLASSSVHFFVEGEVKPVNAEDGAEAVSVECVSRERLGLAAVEERRDHCSV